MSVCACGRSTNDGQAVCDRCAALALFGLTRTATPTEIKDAYRVLAKVWHPDRFPGDEDLRRNAEEKLKEINSAHQILSTTAADGSYREPVRPAPQPEEPQPASTTTSARASYQRPLATRSNASFRTNRQLNTKRLAAMLAILVAGGVSIYLWFGQRMSHITDDSRTQAVGNSAAPDVNPRTEKKQSQNQGASDASAPANKAAAHPRMKGAVPDGASLVVYPDEDPQVPYFTVGSTKSDVIRVQGPPNKVAENVFLYGPSEVYFRNGRVESWRMDPGSPLKARLP